MPALKYGRTMEMENYRNGSCKWIFRVMNKKHKYFIISERGLFLDKKNYFIGASPDCLITCDCCVKIKCPLSINYEKPNEKNLDYLYKSNSEIKRKTNHSYFTQFLLQMTVTKGTFCYFVVCTPHGKVIDTICFDGIMWRDIKEKLIAFY